MAIGLAFTTTSFVRVSKHPSFVLTNCLIVCLPMLGWLIVAVFVCKVSPLFVANQCEAIESSTQLAELNNCIDSFLKHRVSLLMEKAALGNDLTVSNKVLVSVQPAAVIAVSTIGYRPGVV